jgi:hypothetical protein
MYSLPMIAVRNVRASGQWYSRLLACGTDDVAEDFGRLRSDERILLLLHNWEAEEHGAWEGVSLVRVPIERRLTAREDIDSGPRDVAVAVFPEEADDGQIVAEDADAAIGGLAPGCQGAGRVDPFGDRREDIQLTPDLRAAVR